jgi:hypothetical protein
MKWRLAERESFLTEITTRGKVLYEKDHARMGAKSRKRLPAGRYGRTPPASRPGARGPCRCFQRWYSWPCSCGYAKRGLPLAEVHASGGRRRRLAMSAKSA